METIVLQKLGYFEKNDPGKTTFTLTDNCDLYTSPYRNITDELLCEFFNDVVDSLKYGVKINYGITNKPASISCIEFKSFSDSVQLRYIKKEYYERIISHLSK
jgi:hypothetical protein